MKYLAIILCILSLVSCSNDDERILDESILTDYMELNSGLALGDLIACAGGKEDGLFGVANEPTAVIFYPIEGASDFRYFEAENVADSLDFSKYIRKELVDEPLFNGYLHKFNNLPFDGERMGIVTFRTPGTLHACMPIRQKTITKPTEVNPDLGEVISNGTTPTFNWSDGAIEENVIYFQVISDENGELISGTYTFEQTFTFYDLSNVVLNITDPNITPTLEPNRDYKFTMMGVSDDNWVNLFIEKEFTTN